jgi:hypothetical protein
LSFSVAIHFNLYIKNMNVKFLLLASGFILCVFVSGLLRINLAAILSQLGFQYRWDIRYGYTLEIPLSQFLMACAFYVILLTLLCFFINLYLHLKKNSLELVEENLDLYIQHETLVAEARAASEDRQRTLQSLNEAVRENICFERAISELPGAQEILGSVRQRRSENTLN